MSNNLITSRTLHLLIAITIAILTTGFLRLQLFSGVPASDGGFYSFINQYIYHTLNNGEDLKGIGMRIYLYQLMTFWVYGLDVNQFILLRLIDGLVAVIASIVLFKVILKESDSTLFTVILTTALLILMNDIEIVAYGFRNSIWAAYLPLFTALLIWQNSTKEDKYSFYLIGGFVSLGVLLREPFLYFFILAGIAILISYGWRVLIKYSIGSAVVGFSVLAFILMLRDWDLLNLVNSYFEPLKINTELSGIVNIYSSSFILVGILTIKNNWFICITSSISIFYLIKLHWANKKLVNMGRFYFWVAMGFIPLIEPMIKVGFEYHFAQCLPGLAGLSAMGWKHIMTQESKKTRKSLMVVIGLMSLIVILPVVDKDENNDHLFSLTDAVDWAMDPNSFRSANMIERSQYLIAAKKIYELSREDSTLVVSGIMQVLYPLTGLLPPDFQMQELGHLYLKLDYDEERLIKIIQKYRPTLIMTSGLSWGYEQSLPNIIEKTNLYNKVAIVPGNPKLIYGWKFEKPGIIYRLKDFE